MKLSDLAISPDVCPVARFAIRLALSRGQDTEIPERSLPSGREDLDNLIFYLTDILLSNERGEKRKREEYLASVYPKEASGSSQDTPEPPPLI